jgi:DNA-binding transcriptional ArsR family regulator
MLVARARTTLDPFNAVAEPRRRQVLETLAGRELSVNELVELLGWTQPMVSKHLRVLKQVGLVTERQQGRQRLYRANAEQLKPIQDWVNRFEQLLVERFDRFEEYLNKIQSEPEETQNEQK